MDWLTTAEDEQKQGSQAWHEWRSQGLGSSDASVLLGMNPWKTLSQLYREKIGEAEGFKGNFHTERGQRLEPVVRAMQWDAWKPESRVHKDYTWMRASADGWNPETRSLIEIKCPATKPHDGVPDHYMPQCQWLIEVFGAESLEFISYVEGYEPAITLVRRDPVMIGHLIDKGLWFWNCVQTKTPPYATDLDGLVKEYAAIKTRLDALDDQATAIKEQMKGLVTDTGADVGGYRLQWIERKGAVDYGRIPELQGVDLEKYRKKPVIAFDVRTIKS